MMAAQNNKISSFIYFKDRINVNEVDERGSTALHWAAYRGNEETVTYLLTLNELDVDLRDSDGQTSLLVATIYGQTKIVRRLLMRGAKRYLKNKEGQKPIDIAK